MNKTNKHIEDHIEKRIGLALRVGVAIAAIFMIVGFILLAINFKNNFAGFSEISLISILNGLFDLNPYSFMLFGIFLLILTPVIRVVSSIILFAQSKDKLYTVITALVFVILVISFIVALIID